MPPLNWERGAALGHQTWEKCAVHTRSPGLKAGASCCVLCKEREKWE